MYELQGCTIFFLWSVDSDDSGDIAVREAIRKAGEELRKAFDEADELREKDKR